MSFVRDIYTTVEQSAIELFNSLHALTKGVLPSAKQVNNFFKRTIGVKPFYYAPSDYDKPEEVRNLAKDLIKRGYKSLATEYIRELKDRKDYEGLTQISGMLGLKLQQQYEKAKTSSKEFVDMINTLDLIRELDPSYEQKLLQYLKPEHADAIREARKRINLINNASVMLNLASLASGIGTVAVRTMLVPLIRSQVAKAFTLGISHMATATTTAGAFVSDVVKARHEGRNMLTALFDPFTLALAYDVVYHGGKAFKTMSKSTVLEDALQGGLEARIHKYFNFLEQQNSSISVDKQTIKKLSALSEKINPSMSENLLKQIPHNYATALSKMLTLRSYEADLVNELRIFAEAVFDRDSVKEALKKFMAPDGSISISANGVEDILLELAKKDEVVKKYVDTQRLVSLRYALSRASNDNVDLVHVKVFGDDVISYTINIKEEPFDEIMRKINSALDRKDNVVIKWVDALGKEKSVVLRPAYHPSVDDFITLSGVFIAKTKSLESVPTVKEFLKTLPDEVAERFQPVLSKLSPDDRIVIYDKPLIIPYSMLDFGEDALKLTIKKVVGDPDAELVHASFVINLNPARIFPSKLRKLSKKLKRVAGEVEKIGKEDLENLHAELELLKKSGLIDDVERVKGLFDILLTTTEKQIRKEAKAELRSIFSTAEQRFKSSLERLKRPEKLEKAYELTSERLKAEAQERVKAIRKTLKDLIKKRKKGREERLQKLKAVLQELKNEGLIDNIPEVLDKSVVKEIVASVRKRLAEQVKAKRRDIKAMMKAILKNDEALLKSWGKASVKSVKEDLSDTLSVLREVSRIEDTLNSVATTLTDFITTPNFEMRRTKEGLATIFKSYDDMVKYASTRVWNRFYAKTEAIKTLGEVKDFLSRLPNRTPFQDLLLKAINLVEGTSGSDFQDKIIAFNKFLGSVYTMNSLPTAIGNLGQYIAVASTLFPSLKLANPKYLAKYSDEVLEAFKEVAVSRHGVYKFHQLNPFIPLIQATLRASIRASIDTEENMRAVLRDYARFIAKENIDEVVEELYRFYKSNPELLVDDLEKIISAVDIRGMGSLFLKYASTGETILSWYRFILTPITFSLEALKQIPQRISEGDLKAIAKGIGVSTLLASAISTEAVPYLAPVEVSLGVAKDVANLLQFLFGVDVPDVLYQKDLRNMLLATVGEITGIKELHPEDRSFILENVGRLVAPAIVGGEFRGNSAYGDIFERGLKIFADLVQLTFSLPQAKLVSGGAMSFGFGGLTELPSPVLQTAKAIFREIFTAERKDPQDILLGGFHTALMQLVPIGRDIIYMVEGKPLAKGLPAEIREYIGISDKLKDIPAGDLYKLIGASWLIGYMAQFWDGAFTRFFFTNLAEWFGSTEDYTKRFSAPSEADYYKVVNLRDTTFLRKDENIPYITALIKHAKPEHQALIFRRLHRLAEVAVFGRAKTASTALEKLVLSEDFENKKKAVENFIKVYEFTKDYLTPESKAFVEQSIKNWVNFIRMAEEVRSRYGVD